MLEKIGFVLVSDDSGDRWLARVDSDSLKVDASNLKWDGLWEIDPDLQSVGSSRWSGD
jgi:hypothetical protein